MKSILICEGITDLTLIQYFMEVAHHWVYSKRCPLFSFQQGKTFLKNNSELIIGEVGGCSKILKSFSNVLECNKFASEASERFDNIIIISDRDELSTLPDFETDLKTLCADHNVQWDGVIQNNCWMPFQVRDFTDTEVNFQVLFLIIPFEETGALETFLLNAIADDNPYDKQIIDHINTFVESVDPVEKYLNKRRYKTKAKFDVYFSIRTPLEQFAQRRTILQNIQWEAYERIQQCFFELRALG